MAQSQGGNSRNKVELSTQADEDRFEIYTYTEHNWGEDQAEEYRAFLEEAMQTLADAPEKALFVPRRKTIRIFIARWPNARYGHRIFFRETEQGILVLRILHTAMKWQKHLKRGE